MTATFMPRLDPQQQGWISIDDIAATYNAREHPDVAARRRTEADVLREFLLAFERHGNLDGKVTADEFERYFAHNTGMIDDDDYFALMMRQAWGVFE